MSRLTTNDVQKALERIKPQQIEFIDEFSMGNFRNLNIFANSDYGRGLINSEIYGITETIITNEKVKHSSNVTTNNLDSILLSTSLKAYKKSKDLNNSGDIVFTIPPFSFTFSLLVSYHLIMNHIARNLIEDVGAPRFDMGKGILIVSHNIELLSHIWRTSINNVFLRDFVPTYIIERGEYKPFTFKEKKNSSKRKRRVSGDGTLPWLSFYRAHRRAMPEQLELKPEVIILDLLPFYHRKRGQELVKWAKTHAKHVIVIAPSYLNDIDVIKKLVKYCIPVDYSTYQYFNNYVINSEEQIQNSLTASWGTEASLSYLSKKTFVPTLVKYKNLNKRVSESLSKYYEILRKCFTSDGKLPTSIFKINSVFTQMLNISVPLQWYERTRWANNQPTLLELIKKFSKIQAVDNEEIQILNTLLPHLLDICLSFYNLLLEQKYSMRGYLLYQTLNSVKDKNVTVIVTDKTDANELIIWLKSIHLQTNKLKVISQKDWADSQLREIISTEIEIDALVLANPWQKKLLPSFYVPKDIKTYLIDPLKEENIYKYQYNYVFNNDTSIIELKENLFTIFNTEPGNSIENKEHFHPLSWESVKIANFNFFSIKSEKENDILGETVEIGSLFKDERLFELIANNREIDDEDLDMQEIPLDDNLLINSESIKKDLTFIDCYCLEVIDNANREMKVLIPCDIGIKVKKHNDDELEVINPLELQPKDIWIKIKESHRKELFNEILKLASNTLLMQWIQINVEQWKQMLSELWQKYINTSKFKKGVYEAIQKDINLNGGNVESYLTIANWFNGDTLIRGKENMIAITNILNNKEYKQRINTIKKAIEELWGLNIKLGKALVKIIERESLKVNSPNIQDEMSWVNLGNDIVISLEEILNVVQFLEVKSINKLEVFGVPVELSGKLLGANVLEEYIDRGYINSGAADKGQN